MGWIKTILADRMNTLTEIAETIANKTDEETRNMWYDSGGYTEEDTDETLYDICMDDDEFQLLMSKGVKLICAYNKNKNKNNI